MGVLPPTPRGPLSEFVAAVLGGGPRPPWPGIDSASEPLADDDLQLALYTLYELHYRSFAGVDPGLEWDPRLLERRGELESAFLGAVQTTVERREPSPEQVGSLLFELAEADDGPSLSRYLARAGTLGEFREFVIHRSAYQLKEADPHSWAVPRLDGPAKVALVEVQADEYGSGRPERMHSRLFAEAMEALGLDPEYGAYLEVLPGSTLATVNLMSLFGLHRRWRGAIVGHLAMFEITSPEPNRRYANALRRLGHDQATPFFDEHVEADSIHENIAAHDMAGGLARQERELAGDIVFGAEALLLLEARFAGSLLDAWEEGRSSLLPAPTRGAPIAA